jgi:hypothetical protein
MESKNLRFAPKSRPVLFGLAAAAAAALATVGNPGEARADEHVSFDLGNVRVVRQREASGDRPYFPAIFFRSRIGSRGSTGVTVVDYEPHDWVSKPLFRVAPRDHMMNGETATLPFWMGTEQWRNVRVVPVSSLAEAVHAEILGGIVFAFDNNNTPPHVIRGLLDSAGSIVQRLLVERVESGSVIGAAASGDFAAFQRSLGERALQLLKEMINVGKMAELALQFTVGSTFNPDQPAGIQAFIMPALDGMPASDTTQTVKLPGGPVDARMVVAGLGARTETLSFTGSGARYDVPLTIARAGSSTCAGTVSSLTLRVRTGEDDLRDNSVIRAVVESRGRAPMTIDIPTAGGIANRGEILRTITLPTPVPRAELERVGIAFQSRNGFAQTDDNWNMDAIEVRSGSERLLFQRGRPLARMTGPSSTWNGDVRCPAATPSASTPAADPIVTAVDVTLRTGGDDLRGGNDNAVVILQTAGGNVEAPFNGRARLADNTSKTVRVTLPAGVHRSQLRRFVIHTAFGGGIGGDNWNVDAVQLRAITASGSPVILERTGNPLVRFTGSLHDSGFDL